MKKRFLSLFIGLTLILSLSPSHFNKDFSPSVVKAEGETVNLSTKELNEIKFRNEFGLDNDILTVQYAIQNYKNGAYGVHLSDIEEEKIKSRITFQEETNSKLLSVLNREFYNDFTLYIDQSNNGTYHIGVKEEAFKQEVFDSLITPLFTDEFKYEVEFIEKSEKELDEASAAILENQSYLEKRGIIINQIYTDVTKQKVNVGVVNVTEEKIRLLTNLFGKVVHVQEAEENENNNRATTSSTMKGGLKVDYSGGYCSVAFMVKPPTGVKFIVTAGHCYGTVYKQGTNSLGHSMVYYKNSGNTDAGMVGGGPASVDYTGGRIYKTATTNDKYDKTQNATEDVVGELVCMSGASTNTNPVSCGTLNSKNFSATFAGTAFTKLRKASYSSAGGDSGGTVYGSTTLKGVNKGTSGTDGVYSHLEYVMNDLSTAYGSAVHILF